MLVALSGCRGSGETARDAALQALAVRQHAVGVAASIVGRLEPRCGALPLERRSELWASFQTNVKTTVMTSYEGDEAAPRVVMEQLLHLRVDAAQNWSLTEQLQYDQRGVAGLATAQGNHSRELRRVDGHWFSREDGQLFVRAPFMGERGVREVTELVETYERVVAMAGPLKVAAPGKLAGAPRPEVSCSLPPRRRLGWLDALGEDVDVVRVEATFEPTDAAPTRRAATIEMTLTSEPARHITVRVEEFSTLNGVEPILAPAELVSTSSGRDFWRARALLRALMRRRLLPLPLRDTLASNAQR